MLSLHDTDHTDQYGNTPLHIAAANGFDALVTYFINFGAVVSLKNRSSI